MSNPFKSFGFKVALYVAIGVTAASLLSDALIGHLDSIQDFKRIRGDLAMQARTGTVLFDPAMVARLPRGTEAVDSDEHRRIESLLGRMVQANPKVSQMALLVKGPGGWEYAASFPKKHSPGELFTSSMPDFDASQIEQRQAVKDAYIPEMGGLIPGYSPIYAEDGTLAGAVMAAAALNSIPHARSFTNSKRNVILVGSAVCIALVISILVSLRIVAPVRSLISATRRIAEGDFSPQVKVRGSDEIARLSRAFNEMASKLLYQRTVLNEYFFRVVQSLVSGLEAKDHYTRGHSDRVSEYAVMIAHEMGFPKEKVELLRRAAQLHDIGKIGISEQILNKKGPLTDEERGLIREHPVVGEDILKPVFLDMQMLDAVRGHHERFDGTGYPDGKAKSDLTVFAQIISVADTYDAMTSARSYRAALSHEEAVARLKEAAGSQLNPAIVAIFLKAFSRKA